MKITSPVALAGLIAVSVIAPSALASARPAHHQQDMKSSMAMNDKMALGTSSMFTGLEVKKGTVDLSKVGHQFHLRVSDDFGIPASPAPHWQVVDKEGNTYLLNQFRLAGDKFNREITLPKYIKSISKVQVWCSFAEVVLGEASFSKPISLK